MNTTMKTKQERKSISEPANPTKTQWSDFLIFRNSQSEVAINRSEGDFPEHLHEFAEIALILAGHATHRIGRFEHHVTDGDIVVAVPGDRHGYNRASSNFRRVNIQTRTGCFHETVTSLRLSHLETGAFEGRYHELVRRNGSQPILSPAIFSECVRIASAMEREWLAASHGFVPLLKSLFGELLVCVARGFSMPPDTVGDETLRRLRDAVALIDRDYARPITLSEIERVAGMGRRTLERAFKAETGLPPKRYMLKTRISWACRLLANHSSNIQETAAACGFKEQNYFTRAFKQAVGLTPGQFVLMNSAGYRTRKSHGQGSSQ